MCVFGIFEDLPFVFELATETCPSETKALSLIAVRLLSLLFHYHVFVSFSFFFFFVNSCCVFFDWCVDSFPE